MRRAAGLAWTLAAAAISGCVATAPHDVRQPTAPTARIETADLLIDSIDGQKMRDGLAGAPTSFSIAPGWHQLGISRHVGFGRRVRSTYATVCIQAAAGHSYLARPRVDAAGAWTTELLDTTAASAPVATACERPPEPIVARDGVADGTQPEDTPASSVPPVVVTAPADDSRADRPGNSLGVRVGLALGGEALVGARFSNGDEVYLDAGSGFTIAAAGSITPFWMGKRIGVGAGFELGWKYDDIVAANGHASFSRFPLLATVHVLGRLSKRWYVRLGAGIEKHFDCSYSSNGVFGELDVPLEGRVSPVGEIGLYRRLRRYGAVEALLRYSRVRYGLGNATIDGTGVGMLLAVHFNP